LVYSYGLFLIVLTQGKVKIIQNILNHNCKMDPLAKNANPGIVNAKFNYKPACCKSILHIIKNNWNENT
jgi:hypothetical protein